MLEVRGVGVGSATDKAELAAWVQQHQHLPARQQARPQHVVPSESSDATTTVAEFQKMPAAELRQFLQERGVGEGTATDKGELVQWVYQHRHLPVLREDDPQRGQQSRRRTSWRYGPGRGEDPQDRPREEKTEEEKSQEQIEAEKQQLLEGETTKLLEGESETAPSAWRWVWIPLAAVAVLGTGLVTFAVLDAQRSAAEKEASRSGSKAA